MTDHDAARARQAAQAWPDRNGTANGSKWSTVIKVTLPPRDVTDDKAWVSRANCRGMDSNLFFIERGASPTEFAAAKEVCSGCDVRAECLEFAIAHREKIGIWGGTTPKERWAIIRERGLPESLPPPIVHGTEAGYHREIREGRPPCSLCLEAHARYRREHQERMKANRRAKEAS